MVGGGWQRTALRGQGGVLPLHLLLVFAVTRCRCEAGPTMGFGSGALRGVEGWEGKGVPRKIECGILPRNPARDYYTQTSLRCSQKYFIRGRREREYKEGVG